VLVIFNPTAGRGLARRRAEQLRRALARTSSSARFEPTSAPGDALAAAALAREAGFELVVAVGGDGTVSEVVNGLERAAAPGEPVGPLAVLPAGSGNDFAATAGCSPDPAALARALASPRTSRIDLAVASLRGAHGESRRVFDNTLGVGFEARVNRESQRIRWLRGPALYLLAVARALRGLGAAPFELAWWGEDGARHERAGDFLMVTAGNGPRSGGGFYLTPQSRHDDGWLELGTIDRVSRREVLRLLPRVLRGRHVGHPAVRIERCTRFELTSSVPFPVHADGEFLGEALRSVEVELQPGRLELVT
jgi:YegS/Rv2252/BmrU family lipid kinase